MKQTRRRKSAKISDAVFRGKKGDYTFEVYPFAGDIPETAAVFILSRRKVHRSGHISHAASCIGETASLAAEIKKHKRAKCVKLNASNVVCVLREERDKSRTAVLDDIAGSRRFGCIRNVFEPNMLRKPNGQAISATKASTTSPSPDLPLKPVRRKRAVPEPIAESNGKKPAAAPAAVAGGKRTGPKRAAKAKPAKAASAKVKKPKTPTPAKRAAAAKPRTRVQGRVDRDRGQHRLPDKKGTSRGRAKTRTASQPGSRGKAAA